jgi:hypothetical protein
MSAVLSWRIIPRHDLLKLYIYFSRYMEYVSRGSTSSYYDPVLIDLVEKYKSFAADYDGKRFVFVSVKNADDENDYLTGFIVYDRFSGDILYGLYKYSWLAGSDPYERIYERPEMMRLFLRIAMDGRFDVLESLFLGVGVKEFLLHNLVPFLAFCYEFLGDEFIDYLYKRHRDLVDRFNKGMLIYGRNFVYFPLMDIALIRRGDGSIFAYKSPVRYKYFGSVSASYDPLFHRLFSYIIDSAEELDRNMVLYLDECDQMWCEYYVFSSASPPSELNRGVLLLAGRLGVKGSWEESFGNLDIFLIECHRPWLCTVHSFYNAVSYVVGDSDKRRYHESSMTDVLIKYGKDYEKRLLEYIIGFKERFPPELVEEAFERYLHMNVMNVL